MSTINSLAENLEKAWEESKDFDKSKLSNDVLAEIIEFLLIKSTHKTYKYVLVNGLLGATGGNNPLVLQKGSTLPNAWDARSLCHKVLVPFERSAMDSKLGGSNEPFLNKPARFTELAITNAVRGGNDKKALEALIQIFSIDEIYDFSFDLLKFALFTIRQVEPAQIIATLPDTNDIFDCLNSILASPCDGESMVFVSGFLLSVLYEGFDIICHPSNQSGSSSKEVGDIDVFSNGKIRIAVEVKDKAFTLADYQHASKKAKEAGLANYIFISRFNYILDFSNENDGAYLNMVPIENLIEIVSAKEYDYLHPLLITFVESFNKTANPKQTTINHINNILSE